MRQKAKEYQLYVVKAQTNEITWPFIAFLCFFLFFIKDISQNKVHIKQTVGWTLVGA